MKKGQILEGFVKELDFPNKGIIYEEGRKVVVKNAIPGQKIKYSLSKVRKDKCEGRLLEVLEKSELESAENPCGHFGVCGGCSYQTLSYENQLKIKEAQVEKLLRNVCPDINFEGIKPSPLTCGYRNKMEYTFGDEYKGGPLSLGLHRRGSMYDIVNTNDCRLVNDDFNKILTATLNYFASHNVPFYKKMQHTGFLRHLLVRRAVATGQILVALVTTSGEVYEDSVKAAKVGDAIGANVESCRYIGSAKSAEVSGDIDAAAESCDKVKACNEASLSESINAENAAPALSEEELKKQEAFNRRIKAEIIEGWANEIRSTPVSGKLAGILHITNDSLADVVKSDETNILYGQDYIFEEILGLKFKITPFSFFQTNSKGAEVLYDTAREYIGDTKDSLVFDLYSGTGTIGQMMASVADRVIGVEIVEEAVEAAKENAKLNGIENCEFIAGDVLKMLDTIEERPDYIILDPPRDGIHPKALTKIINYGVDRIVYISCKPTSLARDLEVFLENGYEVKRACCVDMFPGTGQVETVVLIARE